MGNRNFFALAAVLLFVANAWSGGPENIFAWSCTNQGRFSSSSACADSGSKSYSKAGCPLIKVRCENQPDRRNKWNCMGFSKTCAIRPVAECGKNATKKELNLNIGGQASVQDAYSCNDTREYDTHTGAVLNNSGGAAQTD